MATPEELAAWMRNFGRGGNKNPRFGPPISGTYGNTPGPKPPGLNVKPGSRVSAGSSQAYQPTGGLTGGTVAAPVSTLAGLPQTPLLAQLIKSGLIKEGMPPEQALAILQFAQLRQGVPIDMAELMKLVEGDYENYTGDILTAGQDWMEELMGTAYDPSDPNAAQFANDPIFSSYAGGMAQLDETADQNLATDLAWFRKNQAAQEQYYNDMMTAISTGTLPVGAAAAATGGGGGGGGGGRGYGGGGGGSGSGSGDLGFGDTQTTVGSEAKVESTRTDQYYENFPGFYRDMLANIPDPIIRDRVEGILNENPTPEEFLAAIEQEQLDIDTKNQIYRDVVGPGDLVGSNELWAEGQFGDLNDLISKYEQLTGFRLGDDPSTPEVNEPFYLPEGAIARQPADEYERQQIDELRNQIMPALEAAGPIRSPVAITEAMNRIAYIRDLAGKNLTNRQSEFVEDLPQSAQEWRELLSPGAGDVGQVMGAINTIIQNNGAPELGTGNYTLDPGQPSSAATPSAPPGMIPPFTDPNVHPSIPIGSEIPVNPTDIYDYYEETGNLPMTPVTDDPNAPMQPTGNRQLTDEQLAGFLPSNPPPPPFQRPTAAEVFTPFGGQLVPQEEQATVPQEELPWYEQMGVPIPGGGYASPNIASSLGPQGPPQSERATNQPQVGPDSELMERILGVPGSRGFSAAMIGPALQAIVKAQLLRPQQAPEPSEPESTPGGRQSAAIERLVSMITSPEIQQQTQVQEPGILGGMGAPLEEYLRAAESMDYNAEDAASFESPNVNPEAIAEQLRNRLLLDPDSLQLREPIMNVRQGQSLEDWIERIKGLTDEQVATIRNEGEWYTHPSMTPEEYTEDERFVAAIPTIQEMSKVFNPNVTMAQVYGRLQDIARESQFIRQQARSYEDKAALAGATGLPNEQPFEMLNPVEMAETDLNTGVGDYGINRSGLKIGDLLRRSAEQMNLPATVTPKQEYTPKKQYTSSDYSSGVKALDRASGAARTASVIGNILGSLKDKRNKLKRYA